MATDSDVKITKYKSAVTIITADFANSIFGGLHGSAEAHNLDDDDPRVRGHVHDGKRGDGHAERVDLVEHVTNQLTNDNLANDAVMKRNIFDTINQEQAIPEYRIDGTKTYYYLDLRSVRSDFPFQEDSDPAGDGSQHKLIRQRASTFDGSAYVDMPDVWDSIEGYDFVFGSKSLNDIDEAGAGDSRFQFDKSKSAFRAGSASGDQWDESKRGDFSVAMGSDNESSGDYSTVSGGRIGVASAQDSTVGGGSNNESSGDYSTVSGGRFGAASAQDSTIGGGSNNDASGNGATISGGYGNQASGVRSSVGGGAGNSASSARSVVAGGDSNQAQGDYTSVAGGLSNTAGGEYSSISGGQNNLTPGGTSAVVGGYGNQAVGAYSGILAGKSNETHGQNSAVSGGEHCKATGDHSNVSGGKDNDSIGAYSTVSGGELNAASGSYSTVSGGEQGVMTLTSDHSTIAGGRNNSIDGLESTISGGYNNSVSGANSVVSGGTSNSISGINSVISGGSGNVSSSPSTVISGGEYNIINTSSDKSSVSGSYGANILGVSNHTVGGENTLIESEGSIVIGGYDSTVMSSDFSFIIGTGKFRTPSLEHHSVGDAYDSSLTYIPDSAAGSSLYSGVLGGYDNKIAGGGRAGGASSPENNFIIAGSENRVGGSVDGGGGIYDSFIAGGRTNEIGSYLGTADPAGHIKIKSGMIIGGDNNVILMGGDDRDGAPVFSSNILYSGIIGGSGNGINYLDHSSSAPLSPWWDSRISQTGSEYGVQTSYIFGGTRNSITNSSSEYFSDLSLYSSILGGQGNVISSSYGSAILGGGAFVDTVGHGYAPAHEPDYDTVSNYYSNIIAKGHHSVILNGSSNLIRPLAFQFDGHGLTWTPSYGGAGDMVMLPAPAFSAVEGREGYSYLYGQHSHASGGHRQEKFEDNGFTIASMGLPPGATFKPMLGSFLNPDNTTNNQPGSAQSSAMTFFGSWDYTPGEIDPGWNPAGKNYFEFRSYLDGGYDEALGAPERCFIPRFPASYNFTIKGALSFSLPTASNYTDTISPTYGAEHHVISFTYTGYIVWQPSGAGLYGGSLSDVSCSMPGVMLDLFDDTGSLSKKDFLIGFCPTEHYASGTSMGPLDVHKDSYTNHSQFGPLVASAKGSWEAPHIAALSYGAPTVWPPRFCIYVVNNSGGTGGTGVGLVGESLVAKADIVENLLFLGRYA